MTNQKSFAITFTIVMVGILTSCSNSNDWQMYGLNGKVKTFIERYYEAELKFGEWDKGEMESFGHNKVLFDEAGKYQWIEYFDDENELTGKYIPKREKGEVIEASYYDEEGKLYRKSKTTHNSNDEFEFVSYDENGVKTTEGKSFYKDNKLIRQEYKTIRDDKPENEFIITYEYDNNGNRIGLKQTDTKGGLNEFIKYEYLSFDKKHNWTKRIEFSSEQREDPDRIVIREYEYY